MGLGIIDSIKGIFDPTMAHGGLNTIQYKYDDGNCISNTPVSIQIDLLPAFSIKDSSVFCANGGPILLTSELVDTVIPYSTNTKFLSTTWPCPTTTTLADSAQAHI